MKNQDFETRGRPRNDDFVDFCELLDSEMPQDGTPFIVCGRLLGGGKQSYLNFRNSASLHVLKKRLKGEGFKVSIYFRDGRTYLKARKA